MSYLVTLATYRQSKTAYFLKQNFERHNIDCFLAFSSSIDSKSEEVRIQVQEMDVERAIKVMLSIKTEYGMDIEEVEPIDHISKILVPTDFSEESKNACHYAIHLAQKLKAEIKILHVYENPVQDVNIKRSSTFEDYVEEAQKDVEMKATAGIVEFTRNIRDYIGTHGINEVKVHSSVVMGDSIGGIKKISKSYKPDVIVLGTSTGDEETGSILASVADEIIKGLEIPVYAIPGSYNVLDLDKMNILYATDFNEKDHTSLDQLLAIMELLEKRINCVHIDTAHNPSKKERMDELNDFLEKEYSQHDIQCSLIEDEDVFHGMKEFTDNYNINLLSFTSKKRGLFEKLIRPNLFKKILQEANLPILVFPS